MSKPKEKAIEVASSAVAVVPSNTLKINEQATPQDTPCSLFIGVEGDVKVLTSAGEEATFKNVSGFMPILVKQVFATGTTATDILALR